MLPFKSINNTKAPEYTARPFEQIGSDVICSRFDANLFAAKGEAGELDSPSGHEHRDRAVGSSEIDPEIGLLVAAERHSSII